MYLGKSCPIHPRLAHTPRVLANTNFDVAIFWLLELEYMDICFPEYYMEEWKDANTLGRSLSDMRLCLLSPSLVAVTVL